MPIRINYITGRTSEFDEFRQSIPLHLEAGGFLICTSGSGDVVVSSKQYRVKPLDLIVALPHTYAHALHTSPDFDGIILGVDMDTLVNADLSNKGFYISSIMTNPCISLRPEEAQKILTLRDYFLKERADKAHPLRDEIDEAILKIIIYEIAALFHHTPPNIAHERSRDDAIFNHFLVQLHSENSQNRSLEYFAQRQSITASHLSKVVKRVSGRSATQWITDYTIMSVKQLLQNNELSIATIAERLGFPNASYLSQYFKKQTRYTPKGYRVEFFSGY